MGDDFFSKSYNSELGADMSYAWVSFTKNGVPSPKWPAYKGSVSTASVLNVSTLPNGQPQAEADQGLASHQCAFFQDFIAAHDANKQMYADFCNAPIVKSDAPMIVL